LLKPVGALALVFVTTGTPW